MKISKLLLGLILIFCLPVFFTSCSDDDELYFTQDELIGDINTGHQVNIGNTILVYNGEGARVNIQGCKGGFTASSANEEIATVRVEETETFIIISGIKIGNTTISVVDGEGKTATLNVTVDDVERLYTTICSFEKDETSENIVQVTGVSDEVAAEIRASILAQSKDSKFVVKSRSVGDVMTSYRLSILDANNETLVDYPFCIMDSEDNDIPHALSHYRTFVSSEEVYKDFYYVVDGENYFVEDLSYEYNTIYPNIQVLMYVKVKQID